jgi:hypothetical protein
MTAYNGINGFTTLSVVAQENRTTYGEVTHQGIRILYEKFKQYTPLSQVAPARKRFYDLGSGVGKVVVGMAVFNSDLEAYGIEIIPERARGAQQAHARLKPPSLQRRVHFIQESFLSPSIQLRDVCWVFISNMCFDAETQAALAEKLKELSTGSLIICSRQLALSPTKAAVMEQNCVVPMSWSNSSSCWIYRILE